MNVQEIGIRELTAQELDEVTGGLTADPFEAVVYVIGVVALVSAAVDFFDWLFG